MLYIDIVIIYYDLSNMNIKVCIILPKLSIGGAEMHVLSLIGHLDTSRIENVLGRIEDLYEWLYRNRVKA